MEPEARAIVNEFQRLLDERRLYEEAPARLFVIMRGLPGSGKTTLAEAIRRLAALQNMRTTICSANHFFEHGGTYNFDPSRLGEAHNWCYFLCVEELNPHPSQGVEIVIVDNTNLRMVDFERYLNLYRWPDMLVVAAFECPPDLEEALQLRIRANNIGHDIQEHTFTRYFNTWRITQDDERNNFRIRPEVFMPHEHGEAR